MKFKVAALVTLFLPAFAMAQSAIGVVGTLKDAQDAYDFVQNAYNKPVELTKLAFQVRDLFSQEAGNYADLNTPAVQNMIFKSGTLDKNFLVLSSESLEGGSDDGAFSITLKKIDKKACQTLAASNILVQGFDRLELNGKVVAKNHSAVSIPECNGQFFFQDGKNVLKMYAS
ncbi:hypothetical protein AB4P97_13605 [Pseudomonas sp. A1230]|uniref:hypothetical protein n=1 Tax=Pseudomonas sp. A1230 TaxID=3235106 RepID=UPI0037837DBF